MNQKRIVRAVPGRLVIDPDTGNPVTGASVSVPDSTFWRRRIKDGDVEEVKPVSPPPAVKTASEPPVIEAAAVPSRSKSKN